MADLGCNLWPLPIARLRNYAALDWQPDGSTAMRFMICKLHSPVLHCATLGLGLMAAACALGGPAMAQQSQVEAWCDDPTSSDDQTIAGCTALIESGRESRHNLAVDYTNRGYAYGDKGDYNRAIAEFDQAIRLDPNYAIAYNDRGMAYLYAKKDYDRALADFSEAIRLDPKLALAYANRGNVYADKADFTHAIAEYDGAIRLDPKLAQVYYQRGLAKRAIGDIAGSDADIAHALQLNPSLPVDRKLAP